MKLGILYTGGTIGCFYKPLRPMTSDEFARLFENEAIPVLRAKFSALQVEYLAFGPPALDSTNLQPLDWCKIVEIILPSFCDHDAFLILHGTDTMAYSASALSFLFTGISQQGHRDAILNKPIILTGSQIPLFDGEHPDTAEMRFNTDAFQNICGAVECAYYGVSKVCLFFHHKLFLGSRAQKTSSNQFDAFSSPNYPPLIQVGIDTTLNHGNIKPDIRSRNLLLSSSDEARERLRLQIEYMKQYLPSIRIAVFEAFPGNQEFLADQLEAILHLDDPDRQLEGLILEAYGAGNMPSGNPEDPTKGKLYRVLARAKERGIVIVNNTKCLSGMVNSGAYASGSWLGLVNVVSAFDMTTVALYSKLLYILALAKRYEWSLPFVRQMLTTKLAGEMVDVHCLDTLGQRSLWPGESLASRDGTARLTNNLFTGPQLVLLDRKTGQWNSKTPVWSAIDHEIGLSCILRMQTDGNLTFRDNALHVLWESKSSQNLADEPFSRLEVVGSTEPGGPSLIVYNYMSHVMTKQLYPAPAEEEDSQGAAAGFHRQQP